MLESASLICISICLTIGAGWYARFFRQRLNCGMMYFWSVALFVQLGTLIAPLIDKDSLTLLFSAFRLELLTTEDFHRAICIVTTGNVVSAIAYGACANRHSYHLPDQWQRENSQPSKYGLLYWILVVAIPTAALAMFAGKINTFISGIQEGYLIHDPAGMYAARESFQELGLPYYILALNALPFIAVCHYLYSQKGTLQSRTISCFLLFLSGFLLFATFEKRPLIAFLALLILLFVLSRRNAFAVSAISIPNSRRFISLAATVCLLVVLLMYLYYLSLPTESSQDVIFLFGYITSRVIGRLSLEAIFYAHCFPIIFDHYGLLNIGKLEPFFLTFGYAPFPDTEVVSKYFTGNDWGSGASSALMDFYGGFGWSGVICGSAIVGVILFSLDYHLSRCRSSAENKCLSLFALLFAYYLTQGSFFRCLSTYGGLTFLGLWLIIHLSNRRPINSRPA